MSRPITKNYVNTNCTYCNKEIYRPKTKMDRAFCSQSCYFSWLRENRPASEIHHRHTAGSLLAELQKIANELQHLPTTNEMEKLSTINPSTYATYFGSWRVALTMIHDPFLSDAWSIDQVSDFDGAWLSGIADGESTFRIAHGKYSYSIIWGLQLRADDIYAMEEVKRIMNLSQNFTFWHRDNDRKRGIDAGDAIRLYIRDIPTHVKKTVPLFTKFPLRSKKAKEFLLFSEAVDIMQQHQSNLLTRKYPDILKSRMDELKLALEQLKVYKREN